MPRIFALLVAATVLTAAPRPYRFVSDFESGMRHGWESYPLAQDAGYDPTLDPVVDDGRKVLARHKEPTKSGLLRLGFVRRFGLTAGSAPSISFAYRLPGRSGDFKIEVLLFHDGQNKRYEVSAQAGAWHTATLPFHGLSLSTNIRAISISADIPNAMEARLEQFFIDDVRVEALREPELSLSEPSTITDDDRQLRYARRSYRPGDDLQIRFGESATVQLHSPDGKLVTTGSGGVLTRKFQTSDLPGIWEIEGTSSTGAGKVLLLLQPQQQRGLIFDTLPPATPELLKEITTKADSLREKVNVDLGPNIATYNDRWLLPGLPSYFALLQPPSELALLEAIRYRYTKNDDALLASRKILRSMASWPRWVHPWFTAHGYRTYYPVGIVAANLALACEFLGDGLPSDERNGIERGFLEKAIVPAFDEYVINNRVAFHTSNWIGHAVGGALLAALVSKDRDAAGYALGLYMKQADHVAATYTSDGAYGEGVSYQRFDLETTALVAAAAKRHLGKSFDDSLVSSYRYILYASYGHGAGMDFGDSHAPVKPVHPFLYMASLNRDPVLSEFYLKNRDASSGLVARLLWEHAVRPQDSKKISDSAVFPHKGNVVMRDGWSAESTVLNLRTGVNFNHNHADQGSFFLAGGGQLLISEAGYSDYYKDPYYQPFTIQAVAHNTLIVDGDPESQILPGNSVLGGFPKFEQTFLGDRMDVAISDLTSVYPMLSKYRRIVVHLKNGPVVVLDEVKADRPHRYAALWHTTAKPNIDEQARHFSTKISTATLSGRAFASVPIQMNVVENPLPLALYEKSQTGAIERTHRIEFSTADAASAVTIVTVLAPGGTVDLRHAECQCGPSSVNLQVGDFRVQWNGTSVTVTSNQGSTVIAARGR